jgi:hypothetical protein
MFAIWISKDKSGYLVVDSPSTKKKENFAGLEFERVHDLKAKTRAESKVEFEAWVKEQQAKEEAEKAKSKKPKKRR